MISLKPKVSYACSTCLRTLTCVCFKCDAIQHAVYHTLPNVMLPRLWAVFVVRIQLCWGTWLCTCMPVHHTVRCMYSEGISRAAEEALQQGSESQPQESSSCPPQAPGADTATGSGGGWKGQQGAIGDLVHLWVAWSPQPCQTMLRLLQGALAQVPSQPLTGKKAQEPVAPYPGDECYPDCVCGSADSWLKMRLQSNKQALALQQFGWSAAHAPRLDRLNLGVVCWLPLLEIGLSFARVSMPVTGPFGKADPFMLI